VNDSCDLLFVELAALDLALLVLRKVCSQPLVAAKQLGHGGIIENQRADCRDGGIFLPHADPDSSMKICMELKVSV
jgi:hypothetical protein